MRATLMTEKAAERLVRNESILKKFVELRTEYPDVSLERIFAEITKDYPMSTAAIRAICKQNNLC